MMERLSPVGADAKSMRREAKRGYELAAGAAMIKLEAMESPTKKSMQQKGESKPTKQAKASAAAGGHAHAQKKKAVLHKEVAALQDAVDGIQRQVEAASKGIQELRELVDSHLMTHPPKADAGDDDALMESDTELPTCVSPPASLMALGQEDELDEFSGEALLFYGNAPMPFSC